MRPCDSGGMAQTVNITLSTDDRERLAAIIGDRNRPQKHVRRTMIILLSGDRLPVLEVARQAGVSRPAVWRWQQRFAEEGVDGLLRDKTRKPGKEHLFLAGRSTPTILPSDSPALHLIQQIRDEAHRFAITGHRQRRAKSRKTSRLEEIPGITSYQEWCCSPIPSKSVII